MRKPVANFVKWGASQNVEFTESWQAEVVQEHNWWSKYGGAPSMNDLPPAKVDAHFAIMEGEQAKREKEQQKAEKT